MEPIINPWVFYLIDMVDGWKTILQLCGGLLWIILFFSIILPFDDFNGLNKKLFIKIAIPLTIVASLIPSSLTIYKMVIADNVTPNNIQIVGDTVEDGIDYIFEKINAVVEEKEAEE